MKKIVAVLVLAVALLLSTPAPAGAATSLVQIAHNAAEKRAFEAAGYRCVLPFQSVLGVWYWNCTRPFVVKR